MAEEAPKKVGVLAPKRASLAGKTKDSPHNSFPSLIERGIQCDQHSSATEEELRKLHDSLMQKADRINSLEESSKFSHEALSRLKAEHKDTKAKFNEIVKRYEAIYKSKKEMEVVMEGLKRENEGLTTSIHEKEEKIQMKEVARMELENISRIIKEENEALARQLKQLKEELFELKKKFDQQITERTQREDQLKVYKRNYSPCTAILITSSQNKLEETESKLRGEELRWKIDSSEGTKMLKEVKLHLEENFKKINEHIIGYFFHNTLSIN